MLKTITAVLATILFVMNAFIRLVDRMKERQKKSSHFLT